MSSTFINDDCPSNDPTVAELKSELIALDSEIEQSESPELFTKIRAALVKRYEQACKFLCHGQFL